MINLRVIGLAAGLAVSAASAAHGVMVLNNGDAVSLAAILNSNDHKVAIGDKLITFGSYTSETFPAAGISVTGFIATNPLDGIGFDLTGGFGDVNTADALPSTFHLSYTVEIDPVFLGRGYRLKDIALVFNGGSNGAGSSAGVHEAVSATTPVGTLDVFAIAGGASQFQDFHNFSPTSFVSFGVNTDGTFLAGPNGGSASASFIRQTFSQVVPTPGAAALLAFGTLAGARRRRMA